MMNLIFSPLLKLLSDPVAAVTSTATAAIDTVTELPDKIVEIVTFNPVEWLFDLIADWTDSLLYWSGQFSLYGVLTWLTFRLVGRVMGRATTRWQTPHVRGKATWLQWRILNHSDLVTLARQYDPTETKVKGSWGDYWLVNAWASGDAARWLKARGIVYTEVIQ